MPETTKSAAKPKTALFTRAGWTLLILAFLGAIILDAFFSDTGMLRVWQLERTHRELTIEVEKLKKENAGLERRALELRGDPQAVERLVREELGFAKPGEVLFLFPQDSPTINDGGELRGDDPEKESGTQGQSTER